MSESLEDICIYGGFEAWEQPKNKFKKKNKRENGLVGKWRNKRSIKGGEAPPVNEVKLRLKRGKERKILENEKSFRARLKDPETKNASVAHR